MNNTLVIQSRFVRLAASDPFDNHCKHLWARHVMLGHETNDVSCECFADMIESLVDAWPDLDEVKDEAHKEGYDEAQEELKDKIEALEEGLRDAKSLTDIDKKTEALSEGHREGEREVLAMLQKIMTMPSRNLRKNVHALIGTLVRKVNT